MYVMKCPDNNSPKNYILHMVTICGEGVTDTKANCIIHCIELRRDMLSLLRSGGNRVGSG